MSRRHRERPPRVGRFVWPVIAAGGLLLVLAAFLFTRQGTSDESGSPQIAVDQQKIDYGYVKFGQTRSFRIAVTNVGDGVLRFKEKPYIEVLEGC